MITDRQEDRRRAELLQMFDQLNAAGQERVFEMAELLTRAGRYSRGVITFADAVRRSKEVR